MTVEQLDAVADAVVNDFTSRIQELNNDEVTYVLGALTQKFDEFLALLESGRR